MSTLHIEQVMGIFVDLLMQIITTLSIQQIQPWKVYSSPPVDCSPLNLL